MNLDEIDENFKDLMSKIVYCISILTTQVKKWDVEMINRVYSWGFEINRIARELDDVIEIIYVREMGKIEEAERKQHTKDNTLLFEHIKDYYEMKGGDKIE